MAPPPRSNVRFLQARCFRAQSSRRPLRERCARPLHISFTYAHPLLCGRRITNQLQWAHNSIFWAGRETSGSPGCGTLSPRKSHPANHQPSQEWPDVSKRPWGPDHLFCKAVRDQFGRQLPGLNERFCQGGSIRGHGPPQYPGRTDCVWFHVSSDFHMQSKIR